MEQEIQEDKNIIIDNSNTQKNYSTQPQMNSHNNQMGEYDSTQDKHLTHYFDKMGDQKKQQIRVIKLPNQQQRYGKQVNQHFYHPKPLIETLTKDQVKLLVEKGGAPYVLHNHHNNYRSSTEIQSILNKLKAEKHSNQRSPLYKKSQQAKLKLKKKKFESSKDRSISENQLNLNKTQKIQPKQIQSSNKLDNNKKVPKFPNIQQSPHKYELPKKINTQNDLSPLHKVRSTTHHYDKNLKDSFNKKYSKSPNSKKTQNFINELSKPKYKVRLSLKNNIKNNESKEIKQYTLLNTKEKNEEVKHIYFDTSLVDFNKSVQYNPQQQQYQNPARKYNNKQQLNNSNNNLPKINNSTYHSQYNREEPNQIQEDMNESSHSNSRINNDSVDLQKEDKIKDENVDPISSEQFNDFMSQQLQKIRENSISKTNE